MLEKCDFLQRVKTLYPRNWFFAHCEVIFLNVKFYPRVRYFNRKMSSLAALNKKSFIFSQKYRFWPFLATYLHIQSLFFQRESKIPKKCPLVS